MNKGQKSSKQQPSGRKRILKSVLSQPMACGNLESAVSALVKRGILGRAARLAVEKQFAQGVPAVWMEDDIIYKVYPNGRKEKLASTNRTATKLSQRRFYIQK